MPSRHSGDQVHKADVSPRCSKGGERVEAFVPGGVLGVHPAGSVDAKVNLQVAWRVIKTKYWSAQYVLWPQDHFRVFEGPVPGLHVKVNFRHMFAL